MEVFLTIWNLNTCHQYWIQQYCTSQHFVTDFNEARNHRQPQVFGKGSTELDKWKNPFPAVVRLGVHGCLGDFIFLHAR